MAIKETKELLELVIEMCEAVIKSLEDGKISVSDIMNFKNVLPKLGAGIIGAGKIREELMTLNESEMKELVSFVKIKFDIPNDTAEILIESAFELIIGFFLTANAIKNARQNERKTA